MTELINELINMAAGTPATSLLRAGVIVALVLGLLSALHLAASVILSTRDRREYVALGAGIVGAIVVEILILRLSANVARAFAGEIQRNGNGVVWQAQTCATIMLLFLALMPRVVIGWFVVRHAEPPPYEPPPHRMAPPDGGARRRRPGEGK